MKNKINVGIIGKNFGYNVIYKSFSKNKNFKITAFCHRSKVAEEIKIQKNLKIYSSWKKLILDKEIQAIVIATPPVLHKKITQFAIKNNKHIFCEKPFTTSYKEASIVCNLIRKKKYLSHMVNYEFGEIDAFLIFKKKFINNIKVNNIYLNWFININKRPKTSWKENHSKGGGAIHNYACHTIYYLESLFGKIASIKTNILMGQKNKTKKINGEFYFANGLSAKLNIQVGSLSKKLYPIHQLKILTRKKTYILETQLNNLSDKFQLISHENNSRKLRKILIKSKKNEDDFRIQPTFNNSKKFSQWIIKNKTHQPNFFDAQRTHLIINKMLISSKKRKKIYIRI